MVQYLKVYGVALSIFLVVDLIWLGVIARTFYQDQLGFILTSSPNWTAAIIFYLMFIAGLLFFAVVPGLKETGLKDSLFPGSCIWRLKNANSFWDRQDIRKKKILVVDH